LYTLSQSKYQLVYGFVLIYFVGFDSESQILSLVCGFIGLTGSIQS
jgi:hypothetical protein